MEEKTHISPIKIQGIKTKLIPEIKNHILIDDNTVWVEPFMGSGIVGFNIKPTRAIFSDINPHIINFYQSIKDKKITSDKAKQYLEKEGEKLKIYDDKYYYEVRERFNEKHDPLDFLFLNRSCFNGMIRFNKKFEFNTPYGHKPNRFSKSYITKIINQIKYIEIMIDTHCWEFQCQSFEKTIEQSENEKRFIYCDPPYIGRHVDYYDTWNEEKEKKLKDILVASHSKFMVSTWNHNKYRKNEYIDSIWKFCNQTNIEHFYFLGGKEENRNSVTETLLTNY